MPDFVHTHTLKVDLSTGVEKRYGGVLLGQGDDSADVFVVKLFDGEQPAGGDATGCEGHFIRPDGRTESMAGTLISGGGQIVLTPACYAAVGVFRLTVKFTSGAAEVTAVVIEGSVLQTYTDEIADQDNVWNLATLNARLSGKISEPGSEGSAGQALITDGNGHRSWGNVSAATASKVKVGSADYTLRTGTAGAAGYITLVVE